jgi:hypothetical protein
MTYLGSIGLSPRGRPVHLRDQRPQLARRLPGRAPRPPPLWPGGLSLTRSRTWMPRRDRRPGRWTQHLDFDLRPRSWPRAARAHRTDADRSPWEAPVDRVQVRGARHQGGQRLPGGASLPSRVRVGGAVVVPTKRRS